MSSSAAEENLFLSFGDIWSAIMIWSMVVYAVVYAGAAVFALVVVHGPGRKKAAMVCGGMLVGLLGGFFTNLMLAIVVAGAYVTAELEAQGWWLALWGGGSAAGLLLLSSQRAKTVKVGFCTAISNKWQ